MLTITYSPQQVKSVLASIGLRVQSETWNDYLCLCPFHANTSTPAFSVSQQKGSYICFSPECGAKGTLVNLIQKMTGRNEFEALRVISKHRDEQFEDEEFDLFQPEPELKEFDQRVLDQMYAQMCQTPEGREYMHERGFTDDTIEYFRIGYSAKKHMVTVPVHSADGVPLGIIGRSVVGKEFHNSYKLPKSKTLFNVHRAKRTGPTAIVNEASFSAMAYHQAGFPGGVATCGGNISQDQIRFLDRYFSRIIIATDFDSSDEHNATKKGLICRKCPDPNFCLGHNPGRDLGYVIAKALPYKEILWACLEPGVSVFGSGKDADDLTDEERGLTIENAMSDFEYMEWNPYYDVVY